MKQDKQDYKLDEIEEEGNQSKSSEKSSDSDNLFSSQKQIKVTRTQKKKQLLCEKLIKTYSAYLSFLSGNQLEEIEQNDLRKFLGKLTDIRLAQLTDKCQYLTEFDYHMGDVVITFPNPDSPLSEDLGTLTQLEAIQLCLNCFAANKYATEFEVMDNLILIKALEQNLYLLQPDDEELARQYEEEDRLIEENQINEMNSQRLNTEENVDSRRSGSRKDKFNIKRWGDKRNGFNEEINRVESKLKGIYNLDKNLRQAAIKEVFNLDNRKLDRFIRIKLSRGKFLEYDEQQKEWIRTGNQTKDFTTLIRMSVILQLSKIGFLMRQFLSKDGSTIFLVLYQADHNLKVLASKFEITKQLNFQFQDIFSYEPVDDNLRPLRINNRLWKENNEYKRDITKMFAYLKPKILELLEKINFKQLARDVNQSFINQQIFSEGQEEIIDDYAPSDEVWKAYYAYLIYIEEKISKFRSQFVITDQLASKINKNNKCKKPYEIYMEKNPDKIVFQDQINSSDIQILETLQKQSEIETNIDLYGRNPVLLEIFKGIFKIIQEQKQQQKYYSQVKDICNIKGNKFINTKDVKVLKKHQIAKQYLDLFQEALTISNCYEKRLLNTIWDLSQIEPFEPFITYQQTNETLAKSQQCKQNAIWKQYCITETGKVSVFSNMERIKINSMALDEKVNFTILRSEKFVSSKFSLNDQYEVFGKSKQKVFNPLFKKKVKTETLKSTSQYFYFFKEMSERQYLEILGQNKYENQEYLFAERKLENLAYQWRFQWKQPWHIPVKEIRNYYGEKIAIYFTFVGYNASMLFPIGLAGLIFNIGEWVIFDPKSWTYIYFYIFFGFAQIQWGNLVHDMWQTKEKVFAMQFGQFNQTGDDNTQQRSQFIGYYSRSIESDNLNILFFPNSKMAMKKILTFSILILMIAFYIGVIVGIFIISDILQNVNDLTKSQNKVALFDVTIPAFINLIVVLVLDQVYDRAVIMLTDYENHKTIKMYEANFIYKKFFISFFSQCMPVLEIQFLHTKFGLHCAENNCLKHSGYHYATMFLFQFVIIVVSKTKSFVWEFFVNLYKEATGKIKKKTKFVQLNIQHQPDSKGSKSLPHPSSNLQKGSIRTSTIPRNLNIEIKKSPASNLVDQPSDKLQFFQEKEQIDKLIQDKQEKEEENKQDKNNEEENSNPFKLINEYIEQQHFEKDSYEISPERYGTVDDFMEILIQHAMLVLFGTTFSLSYSIAFLRSLLELQCDKLKLFNEMQRPIPISESSIGVWNTVLDGLAYLQLLVNTGQIAFQREIMVTSDTFIQTSGFFLICLLANFFLRFVEMTLFNDLPFQIQDLLQRQIYLIKVTVEKFKGSKDKSSGKNQNAKNLKRYPILKIYGCKNKDIKTKELVELSSDSDVEDYIKRQEEIKGQGEVEEKKQPKKVEPKKKHKSNANNNEQQNEDLDEDQQLQKQDSQNMKLLQQASNKEQSIEELQQYFSVRKSNWALKFKMKDTNDKEKQLLQKIFFQKTLSYLKMKDQLNPHQRQWTFDRFTQRKFFLPRSLVLIRNLDWRRYLIFKESDKRLKKNLQLQQNEKYRQQLDFLNKFKEIQQNQVEKMEIIKKKHRYVNKHVWIDGRTTVYLRSGGVWFGQFRKSTSKISGVRIAEAYYKILERFKRVSENETKTASTEQNELTNEMKEQQRQDEKKSLKSKPIDEQFFNLTCNLTNTQLNKFSFTSFISLMDSLTIKHKEHLVCQTSSKGISQIEYQLDNYFREGLRKKFRIMSFSYIPFRIQAPLLKILQLQAWDFFIEEQINVLQPKIHLIYRIDKTKDQFSSNINTNVYGLQPSTKRWLSSNVELPKIQDLSIYYCTEITYNRAIHKDFVNRVYRFYDLIEGPDYENLNLQIGIAKLNYCKIIKQNQFYSFRDPLIKGYLCRSYYPMKNTSFCNGKTLADVIKEKKTKYTDQEISNFIISTIKLFDILQSNFGMFHGALTTENFILVQKQDKIKHLHYVIQDFGMFYWYDFKQIKTHFLRPIQQNNELWYISPELLHNYLNQTNQSIISPQKCDMYSLGMVSLQMVTLGKVKFDLEQTLQEYDGDVALTVRKWMMNHKNSLIHEYPNSSQLIMELLHPDQKFRVFPSTLAARLSGKSLFHEKVEQTQNYEQELDQMIQKRYCPQFFSDEYILADLQDNQSMQPNVSLKSYLKQSVFALEQYIILHQTEAFEIHSQEFEEIINKVYFKNQTDQVQEQQYLLQNFDNYTRNHLSLLIQNKLDEFKYFVMYFQYKMIFYSQVNNFAQSLIIFNTLYKLFDDIDKIVSLVQFPTSMENSQADLKNDENFQTIENQIELGKSQTHLQKFMKQFSHFILVYKLQNYHLGIQINFQLTNYQEAISICKRYIDEQISEIKYDLKYCEKDNNFFIITNQIIIKLLNRVQIQIFKLQVQHDSFDTDVFQQCDEIQEDLTLIKLFLTNEKLSDKQSIVKAILKSSKPKLLNQEIVNSSIGFVNYFESYVLFIKSLCLNRKKLNETLELTNSLQKQLMNKFCIIEQLQIIPMLGWIGEYYSEIDQNDQTVGIFQHFINIMEEQFIIFESFQRDSTIYFNYLRLSLTNLIQYGSQLLYYNSVQQSNSIIQGFMQLIQKSYLYSENTILHKVIQIKLIHILLEMQNQQNPYYFKQHDEQLEYNHEIPNSVINNSLITLLQKLYTPILKYLKLNQDLEQMTGKSWFSSEQLVQTKLELLYGYIYTVSKQNIETEFDGSVEEILKSIVEMIQCIQETQQNSDIFAILENKILLTRAYQLSYKYQQAFDCIEVSAMLEKISIDEYSKKVIQLYFFSIIDCVVNNHFYKNNELSYKEMMSLDTMQFIKNHKFFQVRFFITKLLDIFLKNQQIELNNDLIKFFSTLYSNKAKIFKKEKFLFKLTLEIYKVRNYIKGEELRSLVEKQDKKDNILIQDLFDSVQHAYEIVLNSREKKKKKKKQKVPQKSDISRYLIAQQLEQNDMDKIQQNLINIDDIDQGFNQQVTLCQLGVKLIIYQLHVGQFRDADSMSYNIKRKLFDLIYFELCKMAQQWQSEKIFQPHNPTEISVNQLFKSLNIHEQHFENYEHNLLVNIDPIKNIAINVRNFLALKQILFMRLLYSYVEGLQALCIIMRGDFKQSKQNLSYVQQFGESNIEEVKVIIINLLMQFEITTADYSSAANKSIQLLKILTQRQRQTNLQLNTYWFYNQFENTRTLRKMSYHQIQIEQIIDFDNTDTFNSEGIQFSYLETLTKTTLRPYFEITRLTTEAYLSYIESLIQTPKYLINAVDPVFYVQKYVQQQYGLQNIFNGHLQRLIASMYSEFLINKRVKDLEHALQQGQENKILFLKQEILTKTRVYLESRVKNKCTPQMEKKYQETKLFLKNKIKTLQGITEGISQDVVCRWSIQAANESLQIYQKYCLDFKYESNPYLGLLYSTYADIYFVQHRIVQTLFYLDKVKQTLEYCYTTISNPDYCRYFFQLGYLRLNILQILKLYIEALIGLQSLTPFEKFEVLLAIVTEEKSILDHFDQFCAHGFYLFLERNIQKQLSQNQTIRERLTQSYRKDQQDLIRYLQIEGDKLAFQKTIDANSRPYSHVVENIYKDAVHLIEKSGEKFNPDYTGLELFIKSFQICRLLLTSENTIYQKVLAYVNKLSNRKSSFI